MTGVFISKIIPVAAELLKLGVFKNVAVREQERGNGKFSYENAPVEAFAFYNRSSKNKDVQVLHVYFFGTPENLQVIGYTSNCPALSQGTNIEYVLKHNATKIGEVVIHYEQLQEVLESWILAAQKIFYIKSNKQVHSQFDDTVKFLTDSYGSRFYTLDMMSIHFSTHLPTVHVICETGWGSDYHFTQTKDKQNIRMVVDIDPREVGEDENKTYRDLKPIKNNFTETLEEFFLDNDFITEKAE